MDRSDPSGGPVPFVFLAPHHDAARRAYLLDYGDQEVPGYFCPRDWPHDRCVEALAAWARGEQLQDGWVPCTTVFLEEEGELLGHYNFRHALTDGLRVLGGHIGYAVRPSARGRGCATRLLADALRRAAEHGLDEVLVTVDPANVASVRVIVKNHGVAIDEGVVGGRAVRRYRVATGRRP